MVQEHLSGDGFAALDAKALSIIEDEFKRRCSREVYGCMSVLFVCVRVYVCVRESEYVCLCSGEMYQNLAVSVQVFLDCYAVCGQE